MEAKMKNSDAIKIFLLGAITALLAVIALRPATTEVRAADGMAASAGGLMAVTGPRDAALFIIDPTNKYVSQYAIDSTGFSLRGARYFKHDLYIRELKRKGRFSVDDAEQFAKEGK